MTTELGLVFSNAAEGPAHDAFPQAHFEQRYRLSPLQRTGAGAGRTSPWEHLALYELPPGGARPAGAGAGGALEHGDAAWVYAPAGPQVRESDVDASSKPRLGSGRHVFLALTNPVSGREPDFLAWYEIHVPEVVQHFAGLTTGRLFACSSVQDGSVPAPWRYIALYDLVADDIAEYLRHEQETRDSGRLRQNGGTLDPEFAVWIYSAVGPPVARPASAETAAPAGA